MRRILVVLAACAAVVAGCGDGDTGTDDAESARGGSVAEPATDSPTATQPTTTTTEPASPAHIFPFSHDGYTWNVEISNVKLSIDIADARPGQQLVRADFDYVIRNTTPGRNVKVHGMPFSLVWPGVDACPTVKNCGKKIATVGPAGGAVIIPAGGSSRGHASSARGNQSYGNDPLGYPTLEGASLEALVLGPGEQAWAGCVSDCWMSPAGLPVPPLPVDAPRG